MSNASTVKTKELTIERVFDAPRELVFKAWTDPKLLQQWWGPKGVTNPICEIDAKEGGLIHIVMEAGEEMGDFKGMRWPMKGVFQEVIKPEKLIFTSTAYEREGDSPYLETLVTILFQEQGDKTKMTLHLIVTKATVKAEGALAGMQAGWTQSIDKLGEFLSAR